MRNSALIVLKLAISASLLYLATRQLNFSGVTARLGSLDPVWLLTALIIALVQNWLVALRWQKISAICGAPISPVAAFRFWMIGAFFGQVLPATVGGDAAQNLAARPSRGWRMDCDLLGVA